MDVNVFDLKMSVENESEVYITYQAVCYLGEMNHEMALNIFIFLLPMVQFERRLVHIWFI